MTVRVWGDEWIGRKGERATKDDVEVFNDMGF